MNRQSLANILTRAIRIGIGALVFLIPLVFTNAVFFPYMLPKTVLFRVGVEVLLLAWLILAVLEPAYRLRRSMIVGVFAAFVAASAISTALSVTPVVSFWGDIERGEGLILWLHLLAFLIVCTQVLVTPRQWRGVLTTAVASGWAMSIYAIGQQLGLQIAINTQGIRLSSTIGNPGFLSTALVILIFFALFLATQAQRQWERWVYIVSVVLFTYVTMLTATRGAILGLAAAALASGMFTFRAGVRPLWRRLYLGMVGLLLVGGISLIAARESTFVQNIEPLRRLASISTSEATTQTRLWTWEIALRGWRDTPVWGVGPERFQVVFNKYFNPSFYQDGDSIVWFDRAHNILLDRAVTGGAVGLILFLAIFAAVIIVVRQAAKADPHQRVFGMIWVLAIVAYLVQGMFIFDILPSYVLLVLLIGAAAHYENFGQNRPRLGTAGWYAGASAVWVVVMVPLVWFGTIQPVRAAHAVAESLKIQVDLGRAAEEDQSYYVMNAWNELQRALAYHSYGNQEFRIQHAQFVDGLIANNYHNRLFLGQAVVAVTQELQQQIKEDPANVANWILLIRHYNFAQEINPDFARRVIDLGPETLQLSPRRAQIYLELAKAWGAQARIAKGNGDVTLGDQYFANAKAQIEQVLTLNPDVLDFYIEGIDIAYQYGDAAAGTELLARARNRGLEPDKPSALQKLANVARRSGQYQLANQYLLQLDQLRPGVMSTMINLALSYAYLGDDAKAIEIAERVRTLFPDNATNVASFIADVKDGVYHPAGQ